MQTKVIGLGLSMAAILTVATLTGWFEPTPQFAQVLSAEPITETLRIPRQTCGVEQSCQTIYDHQEKKLGYTVTYQIGDQQGRIRMSSDPGVRIPLDNNGRLVLDTKKM